MLNLSCDGQKHLIFAHLQLLFENRWGYNTQNQYQPIFCAKDLMSSNSERSVSTRSKSYLTVDMRMARVYKHYINV